MSSLDTPQQTGATDNGDPRSIRSSWILVSCTILSVLAIIGAAVWVGSGPSNQPLDAGDSAASGSVTVSVPAGWTEIAADGCATKSFTIVRTAAPLACVQPKAVDLRTLPVAYVSERTSQSSTPIWAEDRLMFGRTTPLEGAVVVSRAPRTPGEGEVFVVAASDAEANSILDQFAVQRATAPLLGLQVPNAETGVASFPAPEIGFMPGGTLDADTVSEVRSLLSGLAPVDEADTRCLVSIDPAQRGALTTSRGVTQLLFQGTDEAPYQLYLGTEACPVVIDSAGASAAMPPDLFKTVAAVVLQDNAEARTAFEQAWGPLD